MIVIGFSDVDDIVRKSQQVSDGCVYGVSEDKDMKKAQSDGSTYVEGQGKLKKLHVFKEPEVEINIDKMSKKTICTQV